MREEFERWFTAYVERNGHWIDAYEQVLYQCWQAAWAARVDTKV